MTDDRRNGRRPIPWLWFGGVALIALLLHLPTLPYDFVWDDNELVVDNRSLARADPGELFTRGFWYNPGTEQAADDMTYYRPLANLSLFLDRQVWGLRPVGYHLTNIVINAAVVMLACLLLWESFGSVFLAGAGGLLVGIHPAMNCVVAFISNRTYLLALLFLLASAYALRRGQRSRARLWPALFGASLLLSALAIEASLVMAALATAWLLVHRARFSRLAAWMAAVAAPVAGYSLLRLGVARVAFADSVARSMVTDPLRVINSFGQQLQLLLFPFNQKVIYVLAGAFAGFSWYTVLGLLFLGLPLYPLVRLGRSDPGRLGWQGYAWTVLFLFPFAHLVFLGPAGRMLYLAAPGALLLLAALYRAANLKRTHTRVVCGAVLFILVVFALQTLRRNPVWRSELSLSRTMVQEAPGSAGAHLNYASALERAGRKDEALEHFRLAAGINPEYVAPHLSLAFALIDRGDLPGAIRELREVVRLRPESPRARNDLALTLRRNGQLDAAIVEYREALRLNPESEETLNNLGFAYLTNGELPRAISCLKAALRRKPDFASARGNLAAAYRQAGMPDSAALVESGEW
jgi:tetratricopeptide (TPR) repeat protein